MTSYQVRADVFPCQITLKNVEESSQPVVHSKVRVIVTLDHIFVFQDANPKPEIIFEGPLVSYTPPLPVTKITRAAATKDRSALFTTEEFEGSFFKEVSCGCGSRLKTATISSLLPNNGIAQAASNHDNAV